jgi:signal transduction histidine kinase
MEIKREAIDLKGFLNDLALKWEASVRERTVVLVKEISPSLPKIETDKNKLEKILDNLFDNAVKFTSQGKIVLGACSRGDAVEITVTDTGIGISRESQKIIFEEFLQVDGSETRFYQGMGLGLALSKKLVRQLGGRIEVESQIGRGSTFRVFLPKEN